RAVEVGGQAVAANGLPAQRQQGADLLGEDRVPGEDRHPVLAGELAEAPGALRAAGGAAAVEVEAAGDTGVDGSGVGVGIEHRGAAVLADLEIVASQQVQAAVLLVEVELVDQQHIGVVDLDDLADGADLRVLPRLEITQQG